MGTGSQLIADERKRQVEQEGWTPEHDDQHDLGQLALSAAAYAVHASKIVQSGGGRAIPAPVPPIWPWEAEWWKPTTDPIGNLVKAGALIAAEIDRLQRPDTD